MPDVDVAEVDVVGEGDEAMDDERTESFQKPTTPDVVESIK